ncbi:hypothetical protein MCGE09_00304 [Thaumarchaeota archaeon SCGC AB-539-E09]|nr:hypothetical protein MCGE09_00304 [Thaumarchaeota archaeon SCGC AB-539-E09]
MMIKEILNTISLEPILLLLLIITFVNIFFLIKILKNSTVKIPQVVDTYSEMLVNITPLLEESEIKSNSDSLFLQNIPSNNNLTPVVLTVRNKIVEDVRERYDCDYCKIFKNLGTVICPNCGTLLNLRSHIDRIANVL